MFVCWSFDDPALCGIYWVLFTGVASLFQKSNLANYFALFMEGLRVRVGGGHVTALSSKIMDVFRGVKGAAALI